MKKTLSYMLVWSSLLFFQTTAVCGMPISTAKIVTPKLEYRNVTLNKLVSIYKHAYVGQRFRIRATVKSNTPEGGRVVRLTLDMTNEAYPARKKASAVFLFRSTGESVCSPCSVTMETLSAGDFSEYTGEEWNVFMQHLINADKRAQDEIKKVLGKSFSPLGMSEQS